MGEEQPGFRKKNAMLPECFQGSWFAHAVSGVYHKIVSPVWWCLPSIHHSSSFVPPSPSWTQRFEKISHDQPIFPGAGSSGVQFLGGDLAGPLAIDDTAFTLIFKAKLGALFPVVILFMLAFSNTAAKVLRSVLRSSSLNPHWVGKDWEIKQGRAPNGQVPTLAKLGSKLLVVSSSWGLLCCSSFMFYKAKKPEAHTYRHSHKGSVLRVQNAISSVALFRLPWRCWLAKDHVKVCKRWNSFLFLILHVSQRWFLWEMSSLKKYVRPGWRSWRIEGSGMWTWGGQGETDSKERGKGRKECQDNGASFQGNGRHSKFLKVSP